MPAKAFLGRDDRGNLGFDLGDGGPPIYLPPTAETAKAAMQFELDAGRDPSLVLAPRRGAMSPDALADIGGGKLGAAGQFGPMPGDTAPRPQPQPRAMDFAPPPAEFYPETKPIPPRPPKGSHDGSIGEPSLPSDAKAAEVAAGGARVTTTAADLQPPAPAAPAQPAAVDPKTLVQPPASGGGNAPGGGRPPPNNNPNSIEYQNWLREEIIRESSKRAGGGTFVKGGKVQTAEQWQGIAGPNADTVEAQRANAAEAARLGKTQAAAFAERDAKVAEIAGQQAAYEQQMADVQAEIGQRKATALADIGGQARALQQKIAAAEVDPNGWYAKKSTGERIGIGVALAIDGIAKGLTRRVGGPNEILTKMAQLQAQDIDLQIKNIDKQRGDLNDLQRIYVQTKEQFGDEALAADATKLAGLAAFKAQIAQEAAKADAVMQTDPVFKRQQLADMAEMEAAMRVALGGDTPLAQQAAEKRMEVLAAKTRSYSVKARLAELAVEKKMLDDQAALEERMNGAISKSFGFTQDRVVGGSAGPDRKRIQGLYKELNDTEGDQRKLSVSEREAAGKDGSQKGLFVDGQFVQANAAAQPEVLKDAQARITYADALSADVAAVRARMKEPGAYAPGDPQAKIDAGALAKSFSRAASNEAASESDKEDMKAAVTPGPRQEAALQRLEGKARSFKMDALKSVGAAKLWLPR